MFAHVASAVSGTQTINFQGRLQTAAGAVVADGRYNMQFKLYQGGSGAAAGNPDGTLKWSETYVNNNASTGIDVRNGYFSVSLGSATPFGNSVDWNAGDLWLSMNVAGSDNACTSFGSGPCPGDGEMLPMKQITAAPFAMNAGALGGKSAGSFVQLGQGVQTDSTNNTSIALNKTGTGNLLNLQANGSDAITINQAGSIALGATTNQSITVADAASGSGKSLTLAAGGAAAGSGLSGGDLLLQGGTGDGTAVGGSVVVKSNETNSSTAFQVQDATGTPVMNVDTLNGVVSVGTLNLGSIAGSSMNLWGNSTPEGAAPYDDPSSLNLATTFSSSVPGQVTGVRFYNPAGNNAAGTDIGKLWACSQADCSPGSGGTELASVTFVADETQGWKTATFAAPVTIDPNKYYIVTYFSTSGRYYATPHFFDVIHSNGPLTAPDNATASNGSFKTDVADFPYTSFNATNYWVDVAFQSSANSAQISTNEDFYLNSGGTMNLGSSNNALNMQGNGINITASATSSVTIQGGSVTRATFNDANLQVGDGDGAGTPVLLTLDQAASAPTIGDPSAMYGSMYYDSTLGRVQCYEADGWGDCGASPDTFVTLSPAYPNAVTNGSGVGTMTTDLCSDSLNINDGSSGQPTICGTNETNNFYEWTSTQGSAQTKSIYVTYQLPTTFKQFVTGTTALSARTDNTDASVSYQIYRNTSTGLVACGSAISVSSGAQTTWQKAAATGGNDPSGCGFAPGDSIVLRVNLTSANNAKAYAGTLGVTYSNK